MPNDNSAFEPGQRVCVGTAQDRIGVLVKVVQDSPGNRRWLVQFPNMSQKLPERNLKPIEENQTVDELIRKGAYGRPRNLRGAITHSRLTGRLADVIYSMEATNTEFFSYQFKPVLNFLESPSNGILIADEVGLGKTIEAGLIWTELRARMDANRLLIICPAVLREKWRYELLHRFGIRADICSASELLAKLREREGKQQEELAVIASIQGLRPPKNWDEDEGIKTGAADLARYISDHGSAESLFDCVVVDEAHYLRNPDSQTHKLAHLIRPVATNVVLLSATPIQLRSDDLFHLLNIIDNENFEFKPAFDGVLEANKPLVSLASKLRKGDCTVPEFVELVDRCLANTMLSDNCQLQDLRQNPPSQEELSSSDPASRIRLANRIERINLLARVISRTRKRDVQSNKVLRIPEAPVIEMNDVELEFYNAVTGEVRVYCEEYDLFEGFMLTIPQRQMCSSMPAALRAWLKKRQLFDEEIIFENWGDDPETSGSAPPAPQESTSGPLITRLSRLATTVGSYEDLKLHDSKYRELLRLLKNYWKENAGSKVILFSYYRETLHYLQERLAEDGVDAALLMGGMGKEKEGIIERFRAETGPNILLASEVLSEGVDLQFSSALVNYDLPWNPMRVEQRIGRIDRIGQKKDRLLIWNFFYQDTLDDRVYTRLFNRLQIFTEALGDMEAVLGERIRGLTYELLSHKLSKAEEVERIEQTANAIEQQRQQQERLEEDAVQLQAHGDYVLNRVSAAKEMQRFIHGSNLWIYIKDFVEKSYPGSNLNIVEDTPLTADIELSLQAKSDLQIYLDKNRNIARTALATAVTGSPTRCVFNNRVDFGDRRHEVINQYHPLVRFVADTVSIEDFHPVIAVTIRQDRSENCRVGQYVFIAKRWSTRGAKTQEKLVYRAVDLSTGAQISEVAAEHLINTAVSHGEDWMNVVSSVDEGLVVGAYEQLENALDDEFDEYCKHTKMENEDRVNFLIRTLKGQIGRQIQSRREAIAKLHASGKDRLVPANLGQIAKLEAKRDQRIDVFAKQRALSSEPQDVIMGVVNVI
tara:strand:- start:2075 stop:5212 length:3138 start_codon:yes stop_codon:yes gene_type:complete